MFFFLHFFVLFILSWKAIFCPVYYSLFTLKENKDLIADYNAFIDEILEGVK
jgi:hypothetical protein